MGPHGQRTTLLPSPAPQVGASGVVPPTQAGLSRRMTGRLRTTPGRFALILAGLVVLGLTVGITAAAGVRQRADLVAGVTSRSGELTVAAQNLYRALSDADATAASAFLSNGLEPADLRTRYQTDIADAAAALTVVSAGDAGGERARDAVARITAQLPVYTGLVETARAYNRQGLPLGVAYLRQASGLMRGELLPAAQELYRTVSSELDEARDRAAAFPWIAMLLGLALVALLVLAQVYLTRRTNRLLNLGLVVSTVAALLLVGWLGVSASTAAGHLAASREDGSAQVNLLVEARTAALQARADEALTLVARGNGAAFEEDYTTVMERLAGSDGSGGLLAEGAAAATDEVTRQALDSAAERARDWLAAHRDLRALDDSGEYAGAVEAATGTGPESTASIFNRLDEELAAAITHNGERFEREAGNAGDALSGVDIGLGVLAALALLGAALGIQRRLMEYR